MPRPKISADKNPAAQKAYEAEKNKLPTLNSQRTKEPPPKSFTDIKKTIESKLSAADLAVVKEISASLAKAGMREQAAAPGQNIELAQTKAIKKDQGRSI